MKEILELIITNLVDNKDEVSIEEIINNKNVDYKVKVSKEDISARLADKYIAGKLEIKVGDTILVR